MERLDSSPLAKECPLLDAQMAPHLYPRNALCGRKLYAGEDLPNDYTSRRRSLI